MSEPYKLQDFKPQTGKFTLSLTQKTYSLRKLSLLDEIWLKENYGSDYTIQKIFTDVDWVKIAEIAFHQMCEEDKKEFAVQSVTFMDQEGKSIKKEIGGARLLFSMISGAEEKNDILLGLLQTIGVSRPVVEEIEKKTKESFDKEVKKKMSSIGQESSTQSSQNTVGA